MNDLLGDVPLATRGGAPEEYGGDVEGGGAGSGNDPKMQAFFSEVDRIKNNMQRIQDKLRSLQEANEEQKVVTRAAAMKNVKERMEGDMQNVLKIARDIKQQIEALDRANAESRKIPGCEAGTGTDRTRMSITAGLKKNLKDLMNAFQDLRAKFQDENRVAVERRYFTVTGKHPDDETLSHLLETGRGDQIFQNAIQEQGRGQLMDTLAEIEERHNAVQEIEAQLQELHQMFLDMAVLVDSQGELLDDIENQVSGAVDHVQEGTKQLVVARKTQLNTRKWIFCGIIVVIIVIVLIVILVIKPWTFKS